MFSWNNYCLNCEVITKNADIYSILKSITDIAEINSILCNIEFDLYQEILLPTLNMIQMHFKCSSKYTDRDGFD